MHPSFIHIRTTKYHTTMSFIKPNNSNNPYGQVNHPYQVQDSKDSLQPLVSDLEKQGTATYDNAAAAKEESKPAEGSTIGSVPLLKFVQL
ncbi:hypothetical protein BGW38_010867 [Lunasporangiospora selenospora]|uniref:Uncharacterized protein n=1 Tax=Lunasporangiospora selenospora TaxID=979761 RepID=A0A9P6FVN7_9FUNG|nr:hypothetical protein BGW38_010867 [Lunasporangiospora selenospora]